MTLHCIYWGVCVWGGGAGMNDRSVQAGMPWIPGGWAEVQV